MAYRYRKAIDWHWLRSLTIKNLNASGKFPVPVNVDGKMEWIESGLYHENYRFSIVGPGLPKQWQDWSLLLRISTQKNPVRSKTEAAKYLLREAETLRILKQTEFHFETPEFICMVNSDSQDPIGLIETWVWGICLEFYKDSIHREKLIPTIAEAAVAVHRMSPEPFNHVPAFEDSRAYILNALEKISPQLFREYPAAQAAKEWILSRLPNRPSTVLHGDLLPQNIICGEYEGQWKVAVIDWEFAEIGDPAYDLAIVTRGDRKLLGINNGLKLLVEAYRGAGGIKLTVADVRIHELLLFLKWLGDSAKRQRRGTHAGHGPDHYMQRLEALLRRADKGI